VDVFVTNPEMSAGTKIGIVIAFAVGAYIFYLIVKWFGPKR